MEIMLIKETTWDAYCSSISQAGLLIRFDINQTTYVFYVPL